MNGSVRTALIIGGIALTLLIAVSLVWRGISGWNGTGWEMMGPGMMGGFGWWWFMPIIMIPFWVLVIWVIMAWVSGVSRRSTSDSDSNSSDSALEVLKRRYARGEISKREYEEKKKDLE